MKTVVLFVIVLVVVQLPNEGNAVCCHGKGALFSRKCADCSKATPYCSRDGHCNIFGCNCDGGCKSGPCRHHHGQHPMTPQVPIPYGGGNHVSYDSKPEAPYYASSASSYDSMPQVVDSPVSYDTDPDVPVDSEQAMSSVEDTQVIEEEPEVIKEEPEVIEEEPEVKEEETQVMEEPEVMEEESQLVDEQMDSLASDNENEDFMDVFGNESQTEVTETSAIKQREISTPEDLIQSADENGDGLMDMDEAEKFLVKRGLVPYGSRVKRSLLNFDRNNDNFLSADEIEPFEEY